MLYIYRLFKLEIIISLKILILIKIIVYIYYIKEKKIMNCKTYLCTILFDSYMYY